MEFECTRRAARPLSRPLTLGEFGCRLCQTWHREGEALYAKHLPFQGKHAFREVDVYQAILEAYAVASARPDPENPRHE